MSVDDLPHRVIHSRGDGLIHRSLAHRTIAGPHPETPDVLPRQDPSPQLLRLARLQSEVVSREQVLGHGMTPRVVDRLLQTTWQALGRGVYYVLPGSPPWLALAWGGVLAGGAEARLGPQAAGHLHGLVDSAPDPVDVLIPHVSRCSVAGPWSFIRERPNSRSGRTVGAPPRLTVEAAAVDLAATSRPGAAVTVLTRALQKRLTTGDRLLEELDARTRHPCRELVRGVVADATEGAHSALELVYLRDVERAHGLPRGHRQRSRAGLPFVSDVGYDAYQLLVELDGKPWHEGERLFLDIDRDNLFALRSWLTLRFGWWHVADHPCEVARQVGGALRVRGWRGVLERCPRCARVPDTW